MFFIAAFIPMLVGALWYGPLFGKAWQKTVGLSDEDIAGGNMPLIFGLSYFLSVILAMGVAFMLVIHQASIPGLFADFDPNGPEAADLKSFMSKYGNVHRTWSHGVVHGIFGSIFLFLPVISIKALFERRSGKYIFINWGYWTVVLAAMGALLCATLTWAPMV